MENETLIQTVDQDKVDFGAQPQSLLGGIDVTGDGQADLSIGQLAELARKHGVAAPSVSQSLEALRSPSKEVFAGLSTPPAIQGPQAHSLFDQLAWTPVSGGIVAAKDGPVSKFIKSLVNALLGFVGIFFGFRGCSKQRVMRKKR